MKAIIFDADFTLYSVNPRKAYEKKFNYLHSKTGIGATELKEEWKKFVENLVSRGVRDYVKRSREYSTVRVLVSMGVEEKRAEKLASEALTVFWEAVAEDLDFDPEITGVIERMKKKYRLCVASDEFRKSLEMKLGQVFGRWENYFEFLVTAEDTKELKPSERFCKIPLERFDLEPREVAFVGDSWKRELKTAKEMGLKTVLVGEEKEGEPDYWIREIKEIEKVI